MRMLLSVMFWTWNLPIRVSPFSLQFNLIWLEFENPNGWGNEAEFPVSQDVNFSAIVIEADKIAIITIKKIRCEVIVD